MKPLVRHHGISRAVRMLAVVALVPLWAILALVSLDTLSRYNQIGNDVAVAAIMLFGAWAWWWSGRRDRRDGVAASVDEH